MDMIIIYIMKLGQNAWPKTSIHLYHITLANSTSESMLY
jgi:hypothetical protein